jgi:hypothetical protein
MDDKSKRRAQFILASMLIDARSTLLRLPEIRPKIFRRNLERILFEFDNSRSIGAKLSDATDHILKDADINWDVIEDVGLSGPMLEWKSNLFYEALGRKKPDGDLNNILGTNRDALTYPDAKPVWGRLFKYLKSLFGSLMEAVKEGTKLKYVLDFIKEYIECLDASVRFVQEPEEAEG